MTERKKWIYKVLDLDPVPEDSQSIQKALTYLGTDGWEVCGVVGDHFVLLKREWINPIGRTNPEERAFG